MGASKPAGPGPVTVDGSPVDFYLLLPPGETEAAIIAGQAPERGTVLELGSAVGRMTHPLVDRGLRVVAVDDSADMLSHVRGAETVQSRIEDLKLGRRFDVVVLASQFANHPDDDALLDLLRVCADHVAADGCVLVQWTTAELQRTWRVGGLPGDDEPHATLTHVSWIDDDLVDAVVTYTAGDRVWEQPFRSRTRTEQRLGELCRLVRLTVNSALTPDRTWLRIIPS